MHRIIVGASAIVASVAVAAGCGGSSSTPLPTGSDAVELDAADFSTEITNPYWPMSPGDRWVYRETEGGEVQKDEVTVTGETKTIDGIDARVVHDVVSRGGEVVEDTFDWYAQDADGNLWYLGEDTKEYENAKLKTTEGSWEHGVDGAQGGIILPADPQPGLSYREEYYKGHAEDGASVLTLGARAKVPHGTYDNLLQTRNYSGIEPDVVEEKFYAQGVGPVLEVTISGGTGRAELVSRS